MGSSTHQTSSNQTPVAPPSFLDRITQRLADQLNIHASSVTPDAELGLALGADSLDIVEIDMALEEEFILELGRRFHPDSDGFGITLGMTVADVEAAVRKRIAQVNPSGA